MTQAVDRRGGRVRHASSSHLPFFRLEAQACRIAQQSQQVMCKIDIGRPKTRNTQAAEWCEANILWQECTPWEPDCQEAFMVFALCTMILRSNSCTSRSGLGVEAIAFLSKLKK